MPPTVEAAPTPAALPASLPTAALASLLVAPLHAAVLPMGTATIRYLMLLKAFDIDLAIGRAAKIIAEQVVTLTHGRRVHMTGGVAIRV